MALEINISFLLGEGQSAPVELELQGPIFQVELCCPTEQERRFLEEGKSIPNPIRGIALIDTGAFATSINRKHVEALELIQTGTKNVGTTFSKGEVPTYSCKFNIVGGGSFSVDTVTALELPNDHIIALLGRDFLAHGILTYNGKLGTVKLVIE